jgi:PKD repeat protein
MSRTVLLTAVVAVAIVAILGGGLASAGSGGGASRSIAPAHSASPVRDGVPVGAPMLNQAVASLNAVAAGSGVSCMVVSGTAAGCGGASPPSHTLHDAGLSLHSDAATDSRAGAAVSHSPASLVPPASPPANTLHWYNVTASLTAASSGVVPLVGAGARLAFDPPLGEVVLYAGSSAAVSVPYESLTWVYNGVSWTNLTSHLTTAPSVRWYPGFDYDPARGGVILVGGWSASDLGLNDTWLFTGTWSNISASVGILRDALGGGGQNGDPLAEGGIGGSGSAWDPTLDGFLLSDGCNDPDCTEAYALTWLLNSTGWWTISFGPGWGTDNPVPNQNLTWLGYTVMAWDPADHYMVEFGGYDYESAQAQNYTYTYSSGIYEGTPVLGAYWDNLTLSDAGCNPTCGTPASRYDASLSWDAQLGAIFLTGGYNDSLGFLNDTWEFLGGHWYSISPGAPSSFFPIFGAALAVNSTDIGLFLVGGTCTLGTCEGNEWVYETPPQATLTETPHPIDVGQSATFTAAWVVGTGTGETAGWNLSTGDGHHTSLRAAIGVSSASAYSKAFAYTYASAGTFTTNVTWSDFFYIAATSANQDLTVDPALVAAITASATTINAGSSVTFSTSPTGGSGSYTYSWSFGDGTTSTAQGPPAHTYAKAGSYVVNLTVTDSNGATVKSSVMITVKSAPSTGPSLSPTDTYAIVGIVIAVVAILAALLLLRRRKKPAAAQPWQAGAPPAGSSPPAGAMSEGPTPPPPS